MTGVEENRAREQLFLILEVIPLWNLFSYSASVSSEMAVYKPFIKFLAASMASPNSRNVIFAPLLWAMSCRPSEKVPEGISYNPSGTFCRGKIGVREQLILILEIIPLWNLFSFCLSFFGIILNLKNLLKVHLVPR